MALKRALLLAVAALVATTSVVFAAFTPFLQAAGTANEAEIREFVKSMKEVRHIESTQLRIIEVVVDSGGTGWHTHPGTPSLVIVEPGAPIDYVAPNSDGVCETRRLNPGDMIFHPSSVHDLRAVGDSSAVFTAIYFSEPGVILTHGADRPC